jgi:GNAT superfamily N-acetyltransferase
MSARLVKSARLTPEEIARLRFGKRVDFTDKDWLDLYLSEFPAAEQRKISDLEELLASGVFVMHETRDPDGKLLAWSISQNFPAPAKSRELPFWLGCWTVTRKEAQSTGVGSLHFPKVVAALKQENPCYFGRFTEIESTVGLPENSQPVRRAKFYQKLGLNALDFPYEMARFQPNDSTTHKSQKELGPGLPAHLLVSPFSDRPLNGTELASIVRRIYEQHYGVLPSDPYIHERLLLINRRRKSFVGPLVIGQQPTAYAGSKPAEKVPPKPSASGADLSRLSFVSSKGTESDWRRLYREAFPRSERKHGHKLNKEMRQGLRSLHKTVDEKGKMLSFSLTFDALQQFVWLSYFATMKSQRSKRIGAYHLNHLLETMKEKYPGKLGLLLAIESPTDPSLEAHIAHIRQYRLQFYLRHGAKRMPEGTTFFIPNFEKGKAPLMLELLWFEFGAGSVDRTVLRNVCAEMYEKIYRLSPGEVEELLAATRL